MYRKYIVKQISAMLKFNLKKSKFLLKSSKGIKIFQKKILNTIYKVNAFFLVKKYLIVVSF